VGQLGVNHQEDYMTRNIYLFALVLLASTTKLALAQIGGVPAFDPMAPAFHAIARASLVAQCEINFKEFDGATEQYLQKLDFVFVGYRKKLGKPLDSDSKYFIEKSRIQPFAILLQECSTLVNSNEKSLEQASAPAYRIHIFTPLIARCEIQHQKFRGKTQKLLEQIEKVYPGYLGKLEPPVIANGKSVLDSAEKSAQNLDLNFCDSLNERASDLVKPGGLND